MVGHFTRSCSPGQLLQQSPTPTPGALCRSSQLRVATGPDVSEKTEQHTLILRIRNVSATRCVVLGYPRITLLDGSGAILPFKYRQGGDQMITGAPPKAVQLAAGSTAYFALNKNACVGRAPSVAASISVALPIDQHTFALALKRASALEYCPHGDPGHVVDLTPIEPTLSAVESSRGRP